MTMTLLCTCDANRLEENVIKHHPTEVWSQPSNFSNIMKKDMKKKAAAAPKVGGGNNRLWIASTVAAGLAGYYISKSQGEENACCGSPPDPCGKKRTPTQCPPAPPACPSPCPVSCDMDENRCLRKKVVKPCHEPDCITLKNVQTKVGRGIYNALLAKSC